MRKGEVAWLSAEEMAAAAEAAGANACAGCYCIASCMLLLHACGLRSRHMATAEELDGPGFQQPRSSGQAGGAAALQQQQQQQQQQQRAAPTQLAFPDAPQMGGGGLQVFDDPFERMMNGRQLPLANQYI